MDQLESLSHSVWECKYHVSFIPKCRRRVLYEGLRLHLGEVFRRLAEQKESRVLEGQHVLRQSTWLCRRHFLSGSSAGLLAPTSVILAIKQTERDIDACLQLPSSPPARKLVISTSGSYQILPLRFPEVALDKLDSLYYHPRAEEQPNPQFLPAASIVNALSGFGALIRTAHWS